MRNKKTPAQILLGSVLITGGLFALGIVLLASFVFLTGAKITHAATILESSAWPLSDPNSADSLGLNGSVITDPPFSNYPLLNTSRDLYKYRAWIFGTTPATELKLVLHNGSSLLDCASETKTGIDYGVSNTPTLQTFTFSGTQCVMATNQRYEFRLSVGSGSGYGQKGLTGIPAFIAADSLDFTVEGQSSNIYAEILEPLPYGTTTATTTFDISIKFYSNNGFDFGTLPAQNIGWRLYDAVTGNLEKEYIDNFAENTAFNFTYSTTTTAVAGSKTLLAFIENADTDQPLAVPPETFFNVATNTYYIATGLLSPRDNPADLTQIDCDTFDVGCQFQKALTFLFVPSNAVLDRYAGLWQQIRNKVPFGYVSAVIDQLGALDDSATPAFTFGDIPFVNSLFTPLKDTLGVILFGIYAIYFYRHRLTQLDI